ncbi:rhodanese-like domain-containing protein [Oceanihabitans sediminis]|uniref:Rhodanese-like domain-containing protein n=1 Tax=Oceanihabitans sediminis TaxID=1812012 RepID=A0A368P7L6_9FLAO|nr:rhodanese-like domain-containing protein [Oceanihabitans sediminis]MDX1278273.1 rhodanese-like domain-containing protein [Oceanihabitans sediminis]MDX1773746.1 rhodanese-like domain-containing protein [Oceanihabitans sediminis]RBP32229.1 rhodanese-related sulfurtransferase [Oceanihabitans sediminis]RCU58877.1 rhodanese-like domain-containing protein [Oceanihabitans sediminis]
MADLSQNQWQEELLKDDNAVILDVRTAEEVEEGYIPNAVHADIYQPQEFMSKIEALDKTKTFYVYCRSGGRSAQACAIMNQMGFENTKNLLGGFSEWTGEVANK